MNITIVTAMNFAQFDLQLPNSLVKVIFDSINYWFTSNITSSSIIITDKSIPFIHESISSTVINSTSKYQQKENVPAECDEHCYNCDDTRIREQNIALRQREGEVRAANLGIFRMRLDEELDRNERIGP
ncbi:hypothetical protein QTN25_004969 [Entamoeba marina]